MKDDVFSKILLGDLPCKPIYEDEVCLAIENKFPKAEIHYLVIPKIFSKNFVDFLDKATLDYSAKFFQSVSHVAVNVLDLKDGFKIIMNNGISAGQTVMYFHVHIIFGNFLNQEVM